jgi:hypothetical protein
MRRCEGLLGVKAGKRIGFVDGRVNERFYEKVIKVKADVAALLS